MALDLRSAQEAVEALFEDVCVVWKDPIGSADDTINEETGEWVDPTDKVEVWRGPCKVRTALVGDEKDTISLPLEVPEMVKGHLIQVIASSRDPGLPGNWFTVIKVHHSTFALSRKLEVEPARKL